MRWITIAEMKDQPTGWYWAAFPGAWIFYRPDCGVLSIMASDLQWHDLGSQRYFGPWQPPAAELPLEPTEYGGSTIR